MGFWVRWRRERLAVAVLAALVVLAASLAPVWQGSGSAAGPGGGVNEEIVGGKPVRDGKYPFMVSVQYRSTFGGFGHRCGGTLLSPNKVLSAAHCFDNRSPANYQVVVGVTVLSSDQGQVRSVTDIVVHPRYTRGGDFRFDSAVLTLDEPVNIAPVTLAGRGDDRLEQPGTAATAAGWGSTRRVNDPNSFSSPRHSDRMREVRLRVVATETCQATYAKLASRDRSYMVDPALMLCAAKQGADSCQGDSGGPLFEQVGGRIVQVGIVSFGYGCAAKGYPGVYTRVSVPEIRDFIRRQL